MTIRAKAKTDMTEQDQARDQAWMEYSGGKRYDAISEKIVAYKLEIGGARYDIIAAIFEDAFAIGYAAAQKSRAGGGE